MLATIATVIDVVIALVLLVWWIIWSRRMLALQERLVNVLSPQALEAIRDLKVDARAVKTRLCE